jgi:alpha-tubulin suppressor-like RCC1 family protein
LGTGQAFISRSPKAVAGGLQFTRVSAGQFGTCGEARSKQAYCWGSFAQALRPVPVAGGHSFAQLSLGGGHACAKTTAAEGFCWGSNYTGELGNGTTVGSTTPTRIAGAS